MANWEHSQTSFAHESQNKQHDDLCVFRTVTQLLPGSHPVMQVCSLCLGQAAAGGGVVVSGAEVSQSSRGRDTPFYWQALERYPCLSNLLPWWDVIFVICWRRCFFPICTNLLYELRVGGPCEYTLFFQLLRKFYNIIPPLFHLTTLENLAQGLTDAGETGGISSKPDL